MDDNRRIYKLPEVRVKLTEGAALYSNKAIYEPEDAAHCMKDMLAELDREYFCVINLDNKCHPLNYNIISIGGIDTVPVPVMNVFKTAILSNASGIMILHNHPSGSIQPSCEDITLTQKIYAASQLMDIKLVDHIIIGGGSGEYYSMLENGHFSVITQTDSAAEARSIRDMKIGSMEATKKETVTVEKIPERKRKHHRSR